MELLIKVSISNRRVAADLRGYRERNRTTRDRLTRYEGDGQRTKDSGGEYSGGEYSGGEDKGGEDKGGEDKGGDSVLVKDKSKRSFSENLYDDKPISIG